MKNEELNQRDLIKNPEKIEDCNFYNIDATKLLDSFNIRQKPQSFLSKII